jgi:spectinomycin phosphotransferase
MREPPDVPTAAVAAAVERGYGLRPTALEFLPLGHDSAAWAFRAETADGAAYFVKLRRLPIEPAMTLVPRALRDGGVERVLAPLRTVDGAQHASLDGHGVVVYPFVDGRTGMDVSLTPQQWTRFGEITRQMHDTRLDDAVAKHVLREPFRPKWNGLLRAWDDFRAIDARLVADRPKDDIAARAQELWLANRQDVAYVVDTAERLATAVAAAGREHVVCQADLHTNNVLVDEQGDLLLIDWDEAVIAPRERDLMFVVGGGISRDLVDEAAEAAFLDGYGAVDVDPATLAYYKHTWAVQDIAEYGSQAFIGAGLGEVSRQSAVGILETLFATGEIVELAHLTLM